MQVDPSKAYYAVLDTNVVLDIFSVHDLFETLNEAYRRVGKGAVDDRKVAYRRARARESLLLAVHLNDVGAGTYSPHELRLLLSRVPPGSRSFLTQFTMIFAWFIKDHLLPRWEARTAPEAKAKGTAADSEAIDFARENSLPLITNEGSTEAGVADRGMRKRAKAARVAVFSPREFYQGKLDEMQATSKFLASFEARGSHFLDVWRQEVGPDEAPQLLNLLYGLYRYILLGEIDPNFRRADP